MPLVCIVPVYSQCIITPVCSVMLASRTMPWLLNVEQLVAMEVRCGTQVCTDASVVYMQVGVHVQCIRTLMLHGLLCGRTTGII